MEKLLPSTTISKIVDKDTNKVIGFTFWKQETLDAITANSGSLAKSNEYQIHYWAIHLEKEFEDGSKIILQFPTVLFNYKQEVSYAAIEFNLKDVEETSNALRPLQELEIKKLLPELQQHFAEFLNNGYKVKSIALNTLHRHPG